MVIETVKPEYTKTVGIIPEGWEVKPISDIAPLQRGFDLPTKRLVKGKYPVVYSNGILNFHDSFQAEAPGVVTGRSGTIGKVTYVENNYWPHNTSLWVTTFKGNHPKFIYYLYIFLRLERFATGSGVPTLNRNDVHSYKILLPKSYQEQVTITEVLSNTDELIEQLDELVKKKKNIKQGAMQELLTGKRRLLGFTKAWEVKELGKIAEIKKGQLITENTRVNGNIPVIAGGKAPPYYHNKPNRFKKTITISASGAYAGFVSFHDYPIFASDCSTIAEGENYSIEYIHFQLQTLQSKIYNLQTGGAQPHVHISDLSPLEISIPTDKEEQKAIAEILSDMDSEIEELEKQRDKYILIKNGMMQKLLTGEIRLQ